MTLETNTLNKLSVVIPVFRSQLILPQLHDRLETVLSALPFDYEIIYVEDCGGDNSWQVICQLAAANPHVHGIKLSKNFGQHCALLCGIRAAAGDIIVNIDDDLQNPPEEIPKLIARLAEGYDVVYGTPANLSHGLLRNYASSITKLGLQSAIGVENASKASAYRAFRSKLRDTFASYSSSVVNVDVLLTWGTSRFSSVTVRQDQRMLGNSGYTLLKLFNHAMNMMTGFSTLPLQLASLLGFIFASMGFMVLFYVLIRYLISGSSVPGFTFIASIISIFSGVQMFALGIFGEYLARMHLKNMGRPPYIVETSITKPHPEFSGTDS